MPDIKNNSQETEKNERIFQEYTRLSTLFEELSEEEFAVLYPTIKQAAFMRVTLEDLADLITAEGPVDAYQNGANQMGMKQSAALQSYNSTIKNYGATIKLLFEKLPRKRKSDSPKEEREEREAYDRLIEANRAKGEIEIQQAVAYQNWQREHPDEDLSFHRWKEEVNQ